MEAGNKEPWWQAVRSVAALVETEGLQLSDATSASLALEKQGFDRDDIARALAWLEQASLSGSMHEVIGMLQPRHSAPRIPHPAELAYLRPDIWDKIVQCRMHGLLNDDFAERLIEGLRGLDVRDLDDSEVAQLIDEVLITCAPDGISRELRLFLKGGELIRH